MIRTKRLPHARTAGDLMTREVVTLTQDMSLRAAARLLSQARISGAPVIDAQGAVSGCCLKLTSYAGCGMKDRPVPRAPPGLPTFVIGT